MKVVEVVSALIFDGQGKMLMTKRRSTTKRPSMWENPGGKVEPRDFANGKAAPHGNALMREMEEELGVPLNKNQCELVSVARLDVEVSLILFLYRVDIIGTPQPLEADALDYFWPEHAIENLPCAPATYLFYRDILQQRITKD